MEYTDHMVTPEPLPSLFLPLSSPRVTLEAVGGKALNLSKLARAGFPVPNGFIIPTDRYHEYVEHNLLGARIAAALKGVDESHPEELAAAAEGIQAGFRAGALPPGMDSALEIAWRWLGAPPVAVRSSATAEDLPGLSFAGQQDTYLNVTGVESLCQAVVDCWASLWTARAIGYRARNGISHEGIALAVVVQKMVPALASGVMFTANPLTGKRGEVVIDATLGLGEALVSGQVEPDHYVVSLRELRRAEAISPVSQEITTPPVAATDDILHKTLGAKATVITNAAGGGTRTEQASHAHQQAIPDEVILELARMGREIETLYGFPQDIEWAYFPGRDVVMERVQPDEATSSMVGKHPRKDIYILQSRPITTLYPLPENLPPEPLSTLIGLHLVQGVMEPITPLGQDTIMLLLTSGGRVLGLRHTIESQTAFYSAAERLWINVTPIIRSPLGSKLYSRAIKAIDPSVAQIFDGLTSDPRLAPQRARPSLRTLWRLARFLVPFIGRVMGVLCRPEHASQNTLRMFDAVVAETRRRVTSSGDLWADFAVRMKLFDLAARIFPEFVIPTGIPPIVAGMASFFGVLERFSHQIADRTGDPRFRTLHLEIARGLPNNVTTEMDLRLWKTAQTLRQDPAAAQAFMETPAPALASAYQAGSLPPKAQRALGTFLDQYGARGVGEIDLGRPRWSEEPTHVIQTIQSYLQITDPEQAPESVFGRGARTAAQAVDTLATAVRQLPGGGLKSRLVRVAARRYRALGGLREAPKFFAIRMMGVLRQGLLASGEDFVAAGLLEHADDLFFLHIAELREIAARREITDELRARIAERRATRAREMLRRQIPRVLLSDGTAFYEGVAAPEGESDAIVGDPVSPGVVEGVVRVVFDPHETQLQPGEILVCPGTDPAWTPLFLYAGGLVMEVGGMMTHGSVVAREYGIPAVVGVHQATTRLKTGQRVRVDGTSGRIEVL